MSRLLAFLFLFFLTTGCNQNNSGKKQSTTDTTITTTDTLSKTTGRDTIPTTAKDSISGVASDSSLFRLSGNILRAIKSKNFSQLGNFIHPALGLRLCPYGYIDTTNSQLLSKKDLITLSNNQDYIVWGSFDGTGAPITLGIHKYFDRFVYDKDFLKAEQRSMNKVLGSGNSLINIKEIYPDADFIEYYFPGIDPKYGGMDWRSLRLVFKKVKNKPYLVAIVHDEWTI